MLNPGSTSAKDAEDALKRVTLKAEAIASANAESERKKSRMGRQETLTKLTAIRTIRSHIFIADGKRTGFRQPVARRWVKACPIGRAGAGECGTAAVKSSTGVVVVVVSTGVGSVVV